jgi:dTDP-4-amino-4,6-dideoxygalactose transaminase
MSKTYVTVPSLPSYFKYIWGLRKLWNNRYLSNQGEYHQKLEEKLTDYLNVDHVIPFCNGTIALLVALKSLNLKGEVITTPFTFAATPNAITWAGLTPVFSDIDEKTLCIDPKKIEEKITSKTSAILAVHVYGIPCDVEAIDKIAKKHNLKVVYDAAHMMGPNLKNILLAGDISMLSFHATKLFHTLEGGALVTKDENLKIALNQAKNFGFAAPEKISSCGINGKMNEFQALMGLLNLENLNTFIEKNKKLRYVYDEVFGNINGVVTYSDLALSQYYYPILFNKDVAGKSRDEVYDFLLSKDILTRKYFYPLCSNYPFFNKLASSDKQALPVANDVAEKILCIPFFPSLKIQKAREISKYIADYLKS